VALNKVAGMQRDMNVELHLMRRDTIVEANKIAKEQAKEVIS